MHSWTQWGCLAGAIVLLLLWLWLSRKQIHPHKYELLECLSYTEWKTGRAVAKEIGERQGGWISYGELYVKLRELVDEGLAEKQDSHDEIGRVRSFRRKPGGRTIGPEEMPLSSPALA